MTWATPMDPTQLEFLRAMGKPCGEGVRFGRVVGQYALIFNADLLSN